MIQLVSLDRTGNKVSFPDECHLPGDVASGYTAVCLYALVGRQIAGLDKKAVGDGVLPVFPKTANEGARNHACCYALGLHERIADSVGRILCDPFLKADQAATVGAAGCGIEAAVEHTAVDAELIIVGAIAYQSAVPSLAADAAVDGNRAAAAVEGQLAIRAAHDAAGILARSVDGAADVQVLDGGIRRIAEGCRVVTSRVVDGQRFAAAVEGAAERVFGRSHHCRYTDVAGQLEVLVEVVVALVDAIRKALPLFSAGNDVGIFCCSLTGKFSSCLIPLAVVFDTMLVCRQMFVLLLHASQFCRFSYVHVGRRTFRACWSGLVGIGYCEGCIVFYEVEVVVVLNALSDVEAVREFLLIAITPSNEGRSVYTMQHTCHHATIQGNVAVKKVTHETGGAVTCD